MNYENYVKDLKYKTKPFVELNNIDFKSYLKEVKSHLDKEGTFTCRWNPSISDIKKLFFEHNIVCYRVVVELPSMFYDNQSFHVSETKFSYLKDFDI